MNGTLGPQGEKVIKFCELLEEETGIKIEYWDERLSTVAAEKTLIQGNVRREKHSAYIVIGIREKYRNKGIGTKFFKKLNDWAQEKKLVRLELTVLCNNKIALN